MPVCFWNDEDGSKYRSAYFERFPGIWAHGDYALTHGARRHRDPGPLRRGAQSRRRAHRHRRDLPAGGKPRRGAGEHLPSARTGRTTCASCCSCACAPGCSWTRRCEKRIRARIRANTTPRHVPAKIVQVADIPRTISGKIVELAVRNVIHGRPVANTDALANPQALELYRDRPELADGAMPEPCVACTSGVASGAARPS
jgi:acetoacetyl-CoA synthetase